MIPAGSGDLSVVATVFVVDDDEAIRDSLRVLFEAYGLSVKAYGSVLDFAREVRVPGRGCLILDQHLSAMTGLDFLASAAGRGLDLPVIMLTGRGDSAIRARAFEAGVAAYIEKPLAGEQLIEVVCRVLAAPAAAVYRS